MSNSIFLIIAYFPINGRYKQFPILPLLEKKTVTDKKKLFTSSCNGFSDGTFTIARTCK